MNNEETINREEDLLYKIEDYCINLERKLRGSGIVFRRHLRPFLSREEVQTGVDIDSFEYANKDIRKMAIERSKKIGLPLSETIIYIDIPKHVYDISLQKINVEDYIVCFKLPKGVENIECIPFKESTRMPGVRFLCETEEVAKMVRRQMIMEARSEYAYDMHSNEAADYMDKIKAYAAKYVKCGPQFFKKVDSGKN